MAALGEFRYRKKTKAAIIIQTHWRRHRESSHYQGLKRSSIIFQCRWRGRIARKVLRKLKMAAKETGALKEAKDKLEKQLEELTWRLHLEKRLRTDLEESKGQEISKLQNSLEALQSKVDETNVLLVKERETKKKALEEATPVIKETPIVVQDTETINSITAEMEQLKHLLKSEKSRASDFERKYSELWEANKKMKKKLEDMEGISNQLKLSLRRFEEKLSNSESENQVLRQQALSMASNTEYPSSPDKGHGVGGGTRAAIESQNATTPEDLSEFEENPQKSLNEKQQGNQDMLITCIAQHLGFAGSRPVAACVMYKCLVHWRSFEAERTTVFDRIIHTIRHAFETQEDNAVLAYWLSNSSTLLLLLQRTLKASGAAGRAPQRRRSSASLFGRMAQSFRGAPPDVDLSLANGGTKLTRVEAKYPALLFKQQLTACVEKIYGMIRDNLKRDVVGFLGLCIQAPRGNKAHLVKGVHAVANPQVQQESIGHWKGMVKSLRTCLTTLQENHVPPYLVRKIFTQIFSFIDARLFNSLLLRRECCSFTNGEYVRTGIAELEHWCDEATDEYAGLAWDELKHIKQAIGFLVIHQKHKKTEDEIIHDLCPVLSIQQIYRISTMFYDDKYGTSCLSSTAMCGMRIMMNEEPNSAMNSSFLLDEDSSIPFTADDISKSMENIDMSGIEPPPLLREDPGFVFLSPRAEQKTLV